MFGPGAGESPAAGRLSVRIAQHVGFVIAVVGQAEEIPVAAELRAQRRRDRQSPCASDRSRISVVFSDPAESTISVASSVNFSSSLKRFDVLAVNPPAAGREFLQPLHLGLRQDGGAGVAAPSADSSCTAYSSPRRCSRSRNCRNRCTCCCSTPCGLVPSMVKLTAIFSACAEVAQSPARAGRAPSLSPS